VRMATEKRVVSIDLVSLIGSALALAGCTRSDPPRDRDRDASFLPSSPVAGEHPPARPSALIPPSRKLVDTCKEICDQSAGLNCKNAGRCLSNCVAVGSSGPCTEATTVFYGCLQKQPLASWECAGNGLASIRAGICDREREKVAGCIAEKVRPSP
jgi:hypothetical protein